MKPPSWFPGEVWGPGGLRYWHWPRKHHWPTDANGNFCYICNLDNNVCVLAKRRPSDLKEVEQYVLQDERDLKIAVEEIKRWTLIGRLIGKEDK